jgi:hypothetical protein
VRFPLQVDLRYVRDIIMVGTGAACIGSQIIAQRARVPISGELIVAGVTMLTATPFLWKGDERADRDRYKGKHEADSI